MELHILAWDMCFWLQSPQICTFCYIISLWWIHVCVSNHLPGYFPYIEAQWSNLEGYAWNILLTNIKPQQLTKHIDGILSKGLYPPCLRMADMALLSGYPRYSLWPLWGISPSGHSWVFWYPVLQSSLRNSFGRSGKESTCTQSSNYLPWLDLNLGPWNGSPSNMLYS